MTVSIGPYPTLDTKVEDLDVFVHVSRKKKKKKKHAKEGKGKIFKIDGKGVKEKERKRR